MGRAELELVSHWQQLFAPAVDLKSSFSDEAFLASMAEIFDPEASIRFVDAEGGALGDMEVSSHGIEGLVAGWTEWLEPWQEFHLQLEEHIDAGERGVLTLAVLGGLMRNGLEIDQAAASLTRIRGGLIVAMDFYLDRDQARADAGLD